MTIFFSRRTNSANRRRSQISLELLEGRCLPSTVINLGDHVPGSLRDAIATTPAGGTVDFQPGLSGTITLTDAALAIATHLTTAGPAAGVITVSDSTLSGNGNSDTDGGAIYNVGTLMVQHNTFSGNGGRDAFGGAIRNDGKMTVDGSIFSGNTGNSGGGIYNVGTISVNNSAFS